MGAGVVMLVVLIAAVGALIGLGVVTAACGF